VKTTETEKSAVVERLAKACRNNLGLDPRDPLAAIQDPQWDKARRTNDWRNYIEPDLIDVWEQLSDEARLSAYLTAASQTYFE